MINNMSNKRKPTILLLILAWMVPFMVSCVKNDPTPLYPPDNAAPIADYNWAHIADSLQEAAYTHYISADNRYYRQSETNNTFHYWWNAHMLDVLVDAYIRTGNAIYLNRMNNLLNGIRESNNGVYMIDYYDDMGWLGLAALRGFDETEADTYREAAEVLWADIQGGINDEQGGGVAWRKNQPDYKNTPATAPAIILACRIYQLTDNTADRDIAVALYTWLKSTLVDPSTGMVWDGINRSGDGEIDRDWLFTYNQGTFIGAALSLFRITGERFYLDDAVRTANAALNSSDIAPAGILKNENQGDGGLFKGIMVRYLTLLAREAAVNDADRNRFLGFVKFNAETAYRNAILRPKMLVGPDWGANPPEEIDLSAHLSGVMLMEAAAQLDELGLL